MASASGPPSNPPAWQPLKPGGAARQAPHAGVGGPGSPHRWHPAGTGSTAAAHETQNGSSALEKRPAPHATQRGG